MTVHPSMRLNSLVLGREINLTRSRSDLNQLGSHKEDILRHWDAI